jgi:hypothetical protein
VHLRLRSLAALGGSALVLLLAASPASAQTIVSPTAPFTAPNLPANEAANAPYPNALGSFTITFSGFPANTQVFAEECDGNAGVGNWNPSADCDLDTEPAGVKSSATGTGTFTAYDINTGFYPFTGESPSQLFACVPPDQAGGNFGGVPVFTNCQLRLTVQDTSTSAAETFLAMATPDPAAVVPETHYEILLPVGALLLLGGGYVIARKRRRPVASVAG